MRQLLAARKPAIAATIPVVSGQAVARMYSLLDMRYSLPCSHQEPIPHVACMAAVDQAPKVAGLPSLADDGRNPGERCACNAAGGEDISRHIQAAAAREDIAGSSAAQVEACEGVTHVDHDRERSCQPPGEGVVQSIDILHRALEQPLRGSEPEESVITTSTSFPGRGQRYVDFAREGLLQCRL